MTASNHCPQMPLVAVIAQSRYRDQVAPGPKRGRSAPTSPRPNARSFARPPALLDSIGFHPSFAGNPSVSRDDDMSIAQPISVPANAQIPNRYGALCTEIYDIDKPPGSLPDVPFYLDRLAGTKGPILEAACGTGRLLIPLLEAGLEVEGFDQSQDMLEVCARHCAARGLSPDLRRARFQDFAYRPRLLRDPRAGGDLHPAGRLRRGLRGPEAVLRPPGARRAADDRPAAPGLSRPTSGRTSAPGPPPPATSCGSRAGRSEIDLPSSAPRHARPLRALAGRAADGVELEVMAFRLWGLKEFELALAAAGLRGDHCRRRPPARAPPGRSSRILNFEARRPA